MTGYLGRRSENATLLEFFSSQKRPLTTLTFTSSPVRHVHLVDVAFWLLLLLLLSEPTTAYVVTWYKNEGGICSRVTHMIPLSPAGTTSAFLAKRASC